MYHTTGRLGFFSRHFSQSCRPTTIKSFAHRIEKKLGNDLFKRTALLGFFHFLPTFYDLFNDGAKPLGLMLDQSIFLDKGYSTVPTIIDQLKKTGASVFPCPKPNIIEPHYQFMQTFIQQIKEDITRKIIANDQQHLIILVDGMPMFMPALIQHIKQQRPDMHISLVEQTRSGINNYRDFIQTNPWLSELSCHNVAESALKLGVEHRFIARDIIKSIQPLLEDNDLTNFGVIGGFGVVGAEVIRQLSTSQYSQHKKLWLFNRKHQTIPTFVHRINDISQFFQQSDIILSLVGRRINGHLTPEIVDRQLRRDKKQFLVNGASSNNDLYAFIEAIGHQPDCPNLENPYADINYRQLTLKYGAYPCNLVAAITQPDIYDPPEDYSLTRLLLLSGLIQAEVAYQEQWPANLYALQADLQKQIVDVWFTPQQKTLFSDREINNIENSEWLSQQSIGHRFDDQKRGWLNIANP